jgi:diguanylate cyclase (GGDEF)-like protein
MAYEELINLLQHVGKDPSRLIFEDELTGISNRRFLHNYFEYKVSWDALAEHPLSLLMMDVDEFKQINDKHGHESGDQALIWVTTRLKEAAGEAGLPIRYAGDEFVLLLPNMGKTEALAVGERLLQHVRQEPCQVQDGKASIRVTLSIGVATAPDDADSGKALLQKADTALYYVKKSGRDGVANAAQLDPQKVFAKAALHQLEAANIAGRGLQLVEVAEAFKRFSRGQSQILLIQGNSGMGKTTFLETIRRNLSQSEVAVAKLTGSEQEVFHPYSLVTHLLSALLNLRPDQGSAIFEGLSPEEATHLGMLLPQLGGAGSQSAQDRENEKLQREALCSTLVHFIPKILDGRPLILLIDDLHFADEASLLVLQLMIQGQEIPVFICGTAVETSQLNVQGRTVPLVRFSTQEQEGMAVRKVDLTPLNAADVAVHLRGIFPQLSLPENVARELERVSQGNPQFLSELIRKLVLDQKVVLVGQRWVIEPFEEGYLPKSLEEIVRQKIATLDEGSRQLLAHASTFGEDMSLSYLTGSTEGCEAEVLEFVDKAVAQGLLSSDFQSNDQQIRFRGKGVQEVTYGDIPEDRKEELHTRIATYQEGLYQKGVLATAAPLVYHFKRSSEPEKAGQYELVQANSDQKLFNKEEATAYSGDTPDVALDAAAMARIPTVIRLFLTAVRSIKLYPPESKAILTVTQQLRDAINQIVESHARLNLVQRKGVLLVNGQKMEVAEFKPVATSFLEALNGIDLEGVAFERGYSDQELKLMIEGLGRVERKMLDRRFWQRFSAEQGLRQIKLKQVRYTEKLDTTVETVETEQLLSAEQKLEREDLPRLNEILRCLLSAARNIKIYPAKSKTVSNTIEQLNEALVQGLSRRPVLTLARAGKAMLVNGEKVDTTEFKALAEAFLEFLPSIGLNSLTFAQPASLPELQQFIEAISQPPASGFGGEFWKGFAKDHGLTSLHFDRRLYELRESQAGKLGAKPQPTETEVEQQEKPVAPPSEPKPSLKLQPSGEAEATPETLNDLLLKGEKEQVSQLIAKLFEGYKGRDLAARRKAVELCRATVERLPMGFQQSFTELVADPLLGAFGEETDAKVFGELAGLLHKMAANLILFGAYLLASRIFLQLQGRQRQLQESKDTKDSRGQVLTKVMNEKLESTTLQLLVEDLKSADSDRQQRAAQVLGGLGRGMAPLLVDVIKQTDDLRVRQLAASLLKEQGAEAANVLKREVVLEISPQERVRILDVIDTVTKELRTEFAFVLDGDNAQVHEAAFRLAERLNDKKVVELLLDYAKNGDSQLATGAIKCLGRLKPAGASAVLVSLLNTMKDTERVVACCRALGQIADPASITPLAKILALPKGLFAFRQKRSPLVRATAAFALGQIPHPQATKALAAHINDQDPRVKKIARSRPKT